MPVRMILAPLIEPVSLAELKDHLRIDHAEEDAVLITLTVVARAAIERLARKAMITQTFRLFLDAWPESGVVSLPHAPVQSVPAVRVFAGGSMQTLDLAGFQLDAVSDPARLVALGTAPQPERPIAGIEVDMVVGFGSAAADVPAPLRQAVKLLAARWYENRGDGPGSVDIPDEILAIAADYRTRRLVA
ncbi:head-tail connector protein [Chthonobacter albigriseus]|uniref:head-tail connector protein n=1 Tax=Chthonobacter albigriseus TaxID=1683161 RepID=UPI0015EE7A64|nr:phage head-tail connector protein [Chthonobacter albigriseus]